MWFVDAAVPYHKIVAQLIPGKSGVNWVCCSGGDSSAVPYLLTMTLTVRFAQSAPFIRVKKCLKSCNPSHISLRLMQWAMWQYIMLTIWLHTLNALAAILIPSLFSSAHTFARQYFGISLQNCPNTVNLSVVFWGLFFTLPIMSCNRAIPKHHFCHLVFFVVISSPCLLFPIRFMGWQWKQLDNCKFKCDTLLKKKHYSHA